MLYGHKHRGMKHLFSIKHVGYGFEKEAKENNIFRGRKSKRKRGLMY